MSTADPTAGKEIGRSASVRESQFSAITTTDIIERLRRGDPTAAEDCVHTYGEYVSELAKYNMQSEEEASVAAAKIFDDIRAFARSGHAAGDRKPEIEIICQIAVRRIVKQQWVDRRTV